MKKLILPLLFFLAFASAYSQVPVDTADARAKVNAWLVTNGTKQITATKVNQLFNGILNLMKAYAIDSVYRINDTLFFTRRGGFTTIKVTLNSGGAPSETDPTVPSVAKSLNGADTARWNQKQEKLTAGTGITIEANVISALPDSPIWNASKLQGNNVNAANPVAGQVLKWNGAEWLPGDAALPLLSAPGAGDSLLTSDGKIKKIDHDQTIQVSINANKLLLAADTINPNYGLVTNSRLKDTAAAIRAAIISNGSVTQVTGSGPISVINNTTTPQVSITNAAADGTTKGAAAFNANDFNDDGSGVVSLDYNNMQVASGAQNGIITPSLFNTFSKNIATAALSATGDFDHNWHQHPLHIDSAIDFRIHGVTPAFPDGRKIHYSFNTEWFPTNFGSAVKIKGNKLNAAGTGEEQFNEIWLGGYAEAGVNIRSENLASDMRSHVVVQPNIVQLQSGNGRSLIHMSGGHIQVMAGDSITLAGIPTTAFADTLFGMIPYFNPVSGVAEHYKLAKLPATALTATVNLGYTGSPTSATITNTAGTGFTIPEVNTSSPNSGLAPRALLDAFNKEILFKNGGTSANGDTLLRKLADTFTIRDVELTSGFGIVLTRNHDSTKLSYNIAANNAGAVTSVSAVDNDGFDVTVNNPTTTPQVSVKTKLTGGSIPYIAPGKGLLEDVGNFGYDGSTKFMTLRSLTAPSGQPLTLNAPSGQPINFNINSANQFSVTSAGVLTTPSALTNEFGSTRINILGRMQNTDGYVVKNSNNVINNFYATTGSGIIGTESNHSLVFNVNGSGRASISTAGTLNIVSLDTDGTPPTTTGTTKMVISDANGDISFTNIPSGGGGLSDGDYGDVVVSSSATVIKVDAHVPHTITQGSVTNAASMDILLTSAALGTTYDRVEIQISARPATDNVALQMLMSTDGGSTFATGASNYEWVANWAHSGGSGNDVAANDTKCVLVNACGNNTYAGANGKITIYNYTNASTWTTYTGDFATMATGGSILIMSRVAGQRKATQDNDAIRIQFSSGNIADGSYRVIGYKNSN